MNGTHEIPGIDEDIKFIWGVTWSNDGTKIACNTNRGLCIVTLTGNVIELSPTDESRSDWSYDSKELYYDKYIENDYSQIFKYDLIENKEFQITDIDKYNRSPRCNQTTNEIVFISGGALVITSPDGLNSKVILRKNHLDSPCWSPNGDKVVFVTENSDLAIIDKTGDNYKIINELPGACHDPQWSSDGKYILYGRAINEL